MRTFHWLPSLGENKEVDKINPKEREGAVVAQQQNKRKQKKPSPSSLAGANGKAPRQWLSAIV